MEHIRTHEVEKLFELWPHIERIFEYLCKREQNNISSDDYIYGMATGNKTLNYIPRSKISDPTGSIATVYTDIMKKDQNVLLKDLSSEALLLSEIMDKLAYAYRKLYPMQQTILSLYYWQKLSWKEISNYLTKNDKYISQLVAQTLKRQAIEKMTKDINFSCRSYDELMNILYEVAKYYL